MFCGWDPCWFVTIEELMDQLSHVISARDHAAMEKLFAKLDRRVGLKVKLESDNKLLRYAYKAGSKSPYPTYQPDFHAMIRLLEEGSRPENISEHQLSFYRTAYNDENLSLLHILFWFESNDRPIKEKLDIRDNELAAFNRSAICLSISQARADFTEAKRLVKQAGEHKGSQAFLQAAANYETAGTLCFKYEEIERTKAMTDPRKTPVSEFFRKKVFYCRSAARECLEQVDTEYRRRDPPVAPRTHKVLLERLAALSGLLGDEDTQGRYQARVKAITQREITDPLPPAHPQDARLRSIVSAIESSETPDPVSDPTVRPNIV